MSRLPFSLVVTMMYSGIVALLLTGCGQVATPILSAGAPPSQPVEVPTDPTGPGIFNVKLNPFYATGDGVTDDTIAVRSAMAAACAANGGEVYFPHGTYVVSPQAPQELGALIVSCDNITMAGAGIGVSTISRKTIGDTDPDAVCPLSAGQVNRGAGIYVTPKMDGDFARRSFHLNSLSLLGNRRQYTGMNGYNGWPATEASCYNMWDVSDKGLYVQQDHDAVDIQVNNAEIAYFSGELLYGGSWGSNGWSVLGSDLHHSNGDAISVTAGIDIENSSLHDLGTSGVENQPYGAEEPQIMKNNQIFNIHLDGVYVGTYGKPFYEAPVPVIDLGFNVLTNVHRFGLVLVTRGGNVHDNQIYDSGIDMWTGCGIGLIGQGGDGFYAEPQNISVTNNTVLARTAVVQCGIQLIGAAPGIVPGYNISITGNTLGPQKATVSSGAFMANTILIDPGGVNIVVSNNTLQ